MEYVSPEYQHQLDKLAENLRLQGLGGVATKEELDQSIEDFDKVFIGNYLRARQRDHELLIVDL